METAIWWIRRDLRLSDNRALWAALDAARYVVPVFVLDPEILKAPDVGPSRLAFLFSGLRQLDSSLRVRGSYLVVRYGPPVEQLKLLIDECRAGCVYAESDLSPYARRRDEQVGQTIPLRLIGSSVLVPPGDVVKSDGLPYTVYTPFKRAWRTRMFPLSPPDWPIDTPECIRTPQGIAQCPIPASPPRSASGTWEAGEDAAHRALSAFIAGDTPPIHHYATMRDRMDLDGTSCLSPYFHLGILSARQAISEAMDSYLRAPNAEARRAIDAWIDELIWREFYGHILYHFPDVLVQSFRPDLRAVPWQDDEDVFAAWREGRTGYPIVDAGMRQLLRTGWMHNRARMITASFLVKDLLVDWRHGARYFMQQLVDGDLAANNGGWQWVAGTGTDAAPFFRIFNPVVQGRKFDPNGDYVRRWAPELADVPTRYIHAPWQMPPLVQEDCGCVVGRHYPAPIVDHRQARERALDVYRQARDRSKTL
ncbi:MAG: deoxyribodipyrimidine photo-lyase [Chloroflexi bacterium]|nr:deoxyribodipyrimidine photo-lyase [Chloroflexota bacterium]